MENTAAVTTIRAQMGSNAELGALNYQRGDYVRAARDYAMAFAYAYSLAAMALEAGDFKALAQFEELFTAYSRQCDMALSAARGLKSA